MGLFDSIKNIMSIPEEDDFDEEIEDIEEEKPAEKPKRAPSYESAAPRREPSPRVVGGGKSKTVNFNHSQMQVVLVKPDRFENASEIADQLKDKRTVVLNLESTNKDVARRLVDFLSGVAYAGEGKIKKVAANTYIITPYHVELEGDLIDELESNGLYF